LLIAEDDAINRDLTVALLRELGYDRVDDARDGKRAREAIEEKNYDAVLMDVQMPLMDGLELTRRLRSGEFGDRYKRLYIIAVTAFALSEDREKCIAAGMDDYLSKPLAVRELKNALVRAYRAKADRKGALDSSDDWIA
jgi:CheY-like chemotaxis protein